MRVDLLLTDRPITPSGTGRAAPPVCCPELRPTGRRCSRHLLDLKSGRGYRCSRNYKGPTSRRWTPTEARLHHWWYGSPVAQRLEVCRLRVGHPKPGSSRYPSPQGTNEDASISPAMRSPDQPIGTLWGSDCPLLGYQSTVFPVSGGVTLVDFAGPKRGRDHMPWRKPVRLFTSFALLLATTATLLVTTGQTAESASPLTVSCPTFNSTTNHFSGCKGSGAVAGEAGRSPAQGTFHLLNTNEFSLHWSTGRWTYAQFAATAITTPTCPTRSGWTLGHHVHFKGTVRALLPGGLKTTTPGMVGGTTSGNACLYSTVSLGPQTIFQGPTVI